VEHACASCGVSVKDGVPFCKNCGAPQIRVAAAESFVAVPAHSPATPSLESGSAEVGYNLRPSNVRRDRIDWSAGVPAVGIAGLTLALSLLFPFGILGGAVIAFGTIASGYISVGIYRRRRPLAQITRGIGASLGALSGAFGFLLSTILFVAGVAVSGSWNQVRDIVFEQMNATVARNPDPKLQELVNQLKTGDGFISLLIGGLLFTGVVIVIVSTVAGWMAARSLERKGRRPGL
jgi:hypothetical protein